MTPAIYLHRTKEGAALRGHPWIFPKAIARTDGHPVTGHLVTVYGSNEACFGVGVYNEHSLYRVRMLAYSFEAIDTSSIETLVLHRLTSARLLRQSLQLPNPLTNAYRLFNSEGDGLSGLTIDCFHQSLVVSSSAYWVEMHRESILRILEQVMPTHRVIWLSQAKPLAQDGFSGALAEGVGESLVSEAGVLFQVNFGTTQKTGLFLDQRENHQRIGALAKGMRVLDLYTYTGGFALHAALGGASQVTAVDSSHHAILAARHNAELNGTDVIDFIEADARDYLNKAGDSDMVILDPPKLVPSQKHVVRAKNYYRFLHREVFKELRTGALLLTCNCSSALSTQDFTELVSAQARATGKVARILGVYGPARCHPMLSAFPEGQYLTAVLLAIN